MSPLRALPVMSNLQNAPKFRRTRSEDKALFCVNIPSEQTNNLLHMGQL